MRAAATMLALLCAMPSPVEARPPAALPASVQPAFPVEDISGLFSDRNYLSGRIDYARHPEFVRLHPPLSRRPGEFLRVDAYIAFIRMRQSALRDGIVLTIVSASRNFDRQRQIWEAKWNALPAGGNDTARASNVLSYSAMPSASRHHWGTDIDINSTDEAYFDSSEGRRIHAWLTRNAATYGFCQVYARKRAAGRDGHEDEPWHWSYMPVAAVLLSRYNASIADGDFTGFPGSGTATAIATVSRYVNGIEPTCSSMSYTGSMAASIE